MSCLPVEAMSVLFTLAAPIDGSKEKVTDRKRDVEIVRRHQFWIVVNGVVISQRSH